MIMKYWLHTSLLDAFPFILSRSTSELQPKEDERGEAKADSDLSFVDELWFPGVSIWGSEHLWSSILEPLKYIELLWILYIVESRFIRIYFYGKIEEYFHLEKQVK